MDISLIISTWNNMRRLAVTLEAMTKCSILKGITWELILVNNNCTDETDKVAQKFVARLPLVYVNEPEQGLSRGRNKGLKAARGQLVVFTDDDVQPSQEWLVDYWRVFCDKPQGFYFGGPIESQFESKDFDHDLLKVAPESVKGFDLGLNARPLQPGQYFLAANWACPRQAIKDLNGFNESMGLDSSSDKVMSGEETDLMKRLNMAGWQGYYLPRAKISHFVPIKKCTLRHIISRWEAYGEQQVGDYVRHLDAKNIFFKIPKWIWREFFIRWVKWISKRVLGRKAYAEYAAFREYAGLIRGLRGMCDHVS